MRKTRTILTALGCALAWIFLAGCAGPAAIAPDTAPAPGATVMLGDFENGLDGWEATGAGDKADEKPKLSLSDQHATHGKQSLKVELPAGPYPGAGIEFKTPQDWSNCQAVRLSLFNASKDTWAMSVRADDTASKDFSTRYNGDMYLFKLAPGANEVEVTMAALRQGSFLARGLDVERIKRIRIFGRTKEPTTLYMDNVSLVCGKPQAAGEMILADFDKSNAAKWATMDGATGTIEVSPDGRGKSLKLELTNAGKYPKVEFTGMNGDWLKYDLLAFDATCPTGSPSPSSLSVKITDAAGRAQTISVALSKGANAAVLPLEIAAEVGLGKVKTLALFAAGPADKQVVHIGNVRLRRSGVENFPTVRDARVDKPALTLDLTDFKAPRNTCCMAMVFIPLMDGRTRIVRCNSPGKGELKYALGQESFAGAAVDKPVRAWVFVSDHGVWSFWLKAARYDGKPLTMGFAAGS